VPDVKHFDSAEVLAVVEQLFWRRGVAATGIQDVVAATGLSRSSLYNSFGGKDELYLAALQRYLEQRSQPMFDRLAADDRGLPALADFFERLLQMRCSGARARWGCLISNAHTEDPVDAASAVLDQHHAGLSAAFRAVLEVAEGKHQLRSGVDLEASAEMLTLLAYGINLRSRSGVPRATLRTGVRAALEALR